MKKIVSLLLVLVLCVTFAVTVYASEAEEYFVIDEADLLTDSEENTLDKKLAELSSTYQAQIIILTVDSLEGTNIDTYLENTYDTLGFGYGQNNDGVLFLICMETREWRILSNGFAGEAINSNTIDKIGDAFISDLSDGNYANALDTFADECEYYLDGYINGFPFNFVKAMLIALGVGLLIALIVTGGWKKQLKSVNKQSMANAYVKLDSMQISQSGDFFMYRNVTKTQRQSSSSSGGGGSSRSTGGGSF